VRVVRSCIEQIDIGGSQLRPPAAKTKTERRDRDQAPKQTVEIIEHANHRLAPTDDLRKQLAA